MASPFFDFEPFPLGVSPPAGLPVFDSSALRDNVLFLDEEFGVAVLDWGVLLGYEGSATMVFGPDRSKLADDF